MEEKIQILFNTIYECSCNTGNVEKLLESTINVIPYLNIIASRFDYIIRKYYSFIKYKFDPITLEFNMILFIDIFIPEKILRDIGNCPMVTSICNYKIQYLNYYLINIPILESCLINMINKYKDIIGADFDPKGNYKILNFRK